MNLRKNGPSEQWTFGKASGPLVKAVLTSLFTDKKTLLLSSVVLKSPDHSKPFSLCCDASNIGISSVLNQAGSDGLHHPVSFFTKKMSKAQKNYSTIGKEALALLLSLKHFEVLSWETWPRNNCLYKCYFCFLF